jgi:hypothetical protein
MADAILNQAVAALKAGDKTEARRLLGNVLAQDSENETAWLWLSGAVETREERIACLENVLSINPDNEPARRGLARLGAPFIPASQGTAAQATGRTQAGQMASVQDFDGSGRGQSAPADHPTAAQRRSQPATRTTSGAQTSMDTVLKVVAVFAAVAVVAIFGYLALTLVDDAVPESVAANPEAPASVKQPEWQQIGSQDGRFAVMMPEFPDYDVQDVLTPVGTLKLHIFSVSAEDSVFMAAYNDYPEFIVNSGDAGKMLDGARDGAVSNVSGKLLSESQIRLQGYPGRELWIEADVDGQDGLARARIYLVGRRLYQILVAGPKNQFPNHDAERCLNSFILVQ